MDINNYEKIMTAFTFAQHQNFVTYLEYLKRTGLTIKDAQEYVTTKRILFKRRDESVNERLKVQREYWNKVALKCPNCKATMMLSHVNNHPANQVGGDYKSLWFCPSCYHDEYSMKPVKDWMKELVE